GHQQEHRAEDDQDRADAIFPKRRAELHSERAAEDIADGLDEARRSPQPDERSEPEQGASANGEHFLHRFLQSQRHYWWQAAEDVGDGQLGVLALPEQMRD